MSHYKLVPLAENHPKVQWVNPAGEAITPIEHKFIFHSTSIEEALTDASSMLSTYARKLADTLDPGEVYLITYRPWALEGGTQGVDGSRVLSLASLVSDVRTRLEGLSLARDKD